MKVLHEPAPPGAAHRSVVTVGTFDGLHRAHREILRAVRDRAAEAGVRSAVVTFDPHPREVVGNGRGPVALLTTPGERMDALREAGIDTVLLLRFTEEFSRLSPREFYAEHVVAPLRPLEVVVGYDHLFGHDRTAGVAELEVLGGEMGFTVRTIPPFLVDGTAVSSTLVRRALEEGDVGRAAEFLGAPYTVRGTVVRGDGRGRTIGWPTANVQPESPRKLIPGNGVYVVRVETPGGVRGGMANIGVRPTFGAGGGRTLEVHLFGESGDLYGAELRVGFLRRLREERRFGSPGELVAQLEADRKQAERILGGPEAVGDPRTAQR